MNKNPFAECYFVCLERYNMRKADVSRASGISADTLARWIRGDSSPNMHSLIRVARVFDLSLSEFCAQGGI